MAKVLIVDDDPDVVEAIKVFLEKEGYETASAYDRESGLAAVSSSEPDLLVLDVMMKEPDDGVAMAQDLRRQGCNVPIIMLTNLPNVTGMDFGRDGDVVPVDEFLQKPIEPSDLVAKVKALVSA